MSSSIQAVRPSTTSAPAPRRYEYGRPDVVTTCVVAALAFITRFAGLGYAHVGGTPVFDEKHYAPQGWDIVRSFRDPFVGGIESNPGYGLIVHPPLGKQLIALGESLFGYTPWGWRFIAALFGVLTVLATMELARRISHSWLVATFAGIIAALDGVLIVVARFGMLDAFQLLFVVLAALFLALDHEQMRHRLYDAWVTGLDYSWTSFGPRFGFRWWRCAAGVVLGLAVAVKWSGLYYMAFFGLMSVLGDLAIRRRYGVRRYVTGALFRDVPPALASLVALPVALYTWTWRAWFASETSVYRYAAIDGTIQETSPLRHLPDALAGWLYYHHSVLTFHSGLTTSSGHSHPWDSKPWSWLAATRPVLYYSSPNLECAGTSCRAMIYLFGIPAIWWLTVPVLVWGFWRCVIGRDRRWFIPLVGFLAGFLPWVAAYDRQMYFFYAAPLVPFTAVLIALTLGSLIGTGPLLRWTRQISSEAIPAGTFAVIAYISLVVASYAYFSPLIYGFMIPNWYYDSMMWLPSWR